MDIYILQLYVSTMSDILSDRGLSLQEEINHVIEHNLAPPERSFYIFVMLQRNIVQLVSDGLLRIIVLTYFVMELSRLLRMNITPLT